VVTPADLHAAAAGGGIQMVNRKRELTELRAALDEARRGRGRLCLIAGEPGIGKTRLAEVVSSIAWSEGLVPLWGRAWESAGAPAYWPWVQILRGLVGLRDDTALAAQTASGAPWLAQIVPELRDRLPGTAEPRSAESDQARFAVFDAAASFLRAGAAAEPLMIVLDDLHAADHASLLLLAFLARRVADVPILLLGTYQEQAVHRRPEVEKLFGDLRHEGSTITLRGFGEQDVGRMVELHAGERWPPQLVRRLHATAEGNPFFTAELVGLLDDVVGMTPYDEHVEARLPLPDTVREAVRRRFEPLSAKTVAALEVAAVIGREFSVTTLEHATGEKEGLMGVIDEAESARVVAAAGATIGRFRFTHNLFRETLYVDLATSRRARLHAAVGEAMERRYGEAPEHLTELAHHFAEAAPLGNADRAAAYATKAGHEAMRQFGYEQASELFQLALELDELQEHDPARRAKLLLALGLAQGRVDHAAATDTLVAAAGTAGTIPDAALFTEAALAIRAYPLGIGVICDQPSALLTEALELLGESDVTLRARALARLAVSLYYWPGTVERRAALAEEAVVAARGLGDPRTLIHVLSNAQLAVWGPDTTERDLAWMEEALALIDQTGDRELELSVRNREIDFRIELDDLPGAAAALRALELTATAGADPRTPAYLQLHRAREAIIEGRYDDADRMNAEARAAGARLHDRTLEVLAMSQLFVLRWAQGRLAEAEEGVRRITEGDVTSAWQAAITILCSELGYEQETRRRFDRVAARDYTDIPRHNGWLSTMVALAELCGRLDDRRRARQLYELLSPFAGRNALTPQATFEGPVTRYLGILAATLGEWEAASAHFAAARAAAHRAGSPPVLRDVNMDEARMLERRTASGDAERAAQLLDEAHAIATGLGVGHTVARIEELRARLARRDDRGVAAAPARVTAATLRREGDVWAFYYEGHEVRVRDSKGMRCLALLLASPGVEMHALQLAAPGMEPAVTGEAGARAGLAVGGDDAGALLDPEAKAAYAQRLEELRDELEEAERFNDPERAAHAREEMQFLAAELSAAAGLGGRDRKAASNAERARVSVTKAIRTAIKRVGEHDRVVAQELQATVRTGTFCVFEPDPRRPVEWRIDAG
jgi:AAA ATPase domain